MPARQNSSLRLRVRTQRCRSLFDFFEPLAGKRHLEIKDRATKQDWASGIKGLVDKLYPEAGKIVLVMDNLATHRPEALYEAFEPAEARRLLDHLELHYTPKHASWLNMAEIDLSALSRQCLDRRLPDQQTLAHCVGAWERGMNARGAAVDWRFTTEDARIKLKRLYPVLPLINQDATEH